MKSDYNTSYLFDLDGTLVDSLRDIADSMNEILERKGLPTHPIPAYNTFVGDGMEPLVKRVLPKGECGTPSEVQVWIRELKDAYALRWKQHSAPYPGILDLLHTLAERNHCLGVLSNKPEAFTRQMVSHLFGGVPFRSVRGARDGIPVKPDPTAALELLAEWEVDAASILYVGDTDTDMKTGRAAGFTTIGVSWGFRSEQELQESGAHLVVHSPEQLLDIPSQLPERFT